LNFFILAFVIFVMVRQINRLKTTQQAEAAPEAAPFTPEDVLLLREIRDSLKNKA
jgi:large conductance mechanosensitive channel